jgi:NAD(P)H-hydrate repair Nnr-like enzyme with NAD(P)H-hydrate dehydratase domain
MARGAPLEQACAWGVALHARAGERLCQRLGPLGYLAREILDEIPALMHALRPQ